MLFIQGRFSAAMVGSVFLLNDRSIFPAKKRAYSSTGGGTKQLMSTRSHGLLSMAFIAFLGIASYAHAETTADGQGRTRKSEVRFGILAHDVDGLWSGFRREGGIDYNAEYIFGSASFDLLSGYVRPNIGISVNDSGDTNKVYAGLLWEYDFKSGIFLNLGAGLAVHDGEIDTS